MIQIKFKIGQKVIWTSDAYCFEGIVKSGNEETTFVTFTKALNPFSKAIVLPLNQYCATRLLKPLTLGFITLEAVNKPEIT